MSWGSARTTACAVADETGVESVAIHALGAAQGGVAVKAVAVAGSTAVAGNGKRVGGAAICAE